MTPPANGSSKTATITVASTKLEGVRKSVPPAPQERKSGAVYFWAIAGLAQLALWTNNWVRWVPSAEFKRPDPGPDPYPYMYVLRGTEALNVFLFLFIGHYTVVKPWAKNGYPSLDGKLFIGGFFASTLDIMFAWFNPTWAMNAYGVAMGSWANKIPGFPAPGASQVPWGLLWCLPAYIWLGVGAAIFGCAILDRLRAAFPTMSTATMYVFVDGVYIAIFTCLAMFWNRTQVYTYVSLPKALTLWYGETYQLPMYEPVLIGMYCWGFTWVRDGRDARGRCPLDRELPAPDRNQLRTEMLSTVAIIGWAAAVTIIAYMVPFSWLAMMGDSVPELPSYLQSGIYCGQPGGPLCPGQYLAKLRMELP
ncbi:uncharacterized protein E0L32_007561 [Thyridium curvatum]|uniref:Uncharacterized protein n=1 Tax=Thyridium curvatum TaxID=1093900 RepID=A0A507AZF6_9PEZI|nr:uncharacterized protein E0L32_007561 [Thyridium curvatum]TPX11824.1 hypothetical protein E0L32_007561 [Thyridium curvatum]